MTTARTQGVRPGRVPIRDVELYVDVVGEGYPLLLLLMHGASSTDHRTLQSFRQCDDQFTVIFYDHRAGEFLAQRGCAPKKVELPARSMSSRCA